VGENNSIKGSVTLNGLEVVFMEMSRLGGVPPAIHYFFKTLSLLLN
jgi:hypothetical protein